MNVTAYRLALLGLPNVGHRSAAAILRRFPTPDTLLAATVSDLAGLNGVPGRIRASMRTVVERRLPGAERQLRQLQDAGVSVVEPTDLGFPTRLGALPSPPILLFVKGSTEALTAAGVAVVGTRTPTEAGVEIASRISRLLVADGYCVVSGLALGIDAAAHRAALGAGGRTVAFLPSALDRLYPREHVHLAAQIAASGGALVTEYPPGAAPARTQFVQRDRLQAGLSLAVVAVQTEVTGGTMHTVRFAETYGRPVYCPAAPPEEAGHPAWTGIARLVEEGRARTFGRDDGPALFARLRQQRAIP